MSITLRFLLDNVHMIYFAKQGYTLKLDNIAPGQFRQNNCELKKLVKTQDYCQMGRVFWTEWTQCSRIVPRVIWLKFKKVSVLFFRLLKKQPAIRC